MATTTEASADTGSATARAARLYTEGNALRQQGRWADAMERYARAAELDPGSPARCAREMLRGILDYRCRALMNP